MSAFSVFLFSGSSASGRIRSGPRLAVANRRGFTLLEVLVALIVLSIGLLGLSGLQTTGLSSNHSAMLRAEATMLANDILDRMRANRTAALAGSYNSAYSDTGGSACSANCTPAQVAAADLAAWRGYISRLPGGEGQVTVANGVATIRVRWVDGRVGATIEPFVTVTAI